MPIVDRRSGAITPANMRNADVASRLVKDIAPIQQSRMQSAFRVQGIQAILYNRLDQGRPCVCHRRNTEAARLSPDGKASQGAINRIITGNSNFGIGPYNPADTPIETSTIRETSPLSASGKFRGDLNKVGSPLDEEFNQLEDEATLGDNGQYSPDMENLFDGFDMSQLGLSDISCPICFGTNYVGGYSAFRAWRQVYLASDLNSPNSFFDTADFSLSPGTHEVVITPPRGVTVLDVCRVMNGRDTIPATLFLDGVDITRSRFIDYCDGRPHTLKIVTEESLTHVEIQAALSNEPVYFEFPKLTKSSDLSHLDQTEPFTIVVSSDIPHLGTLDVIAEQQSGRILVVQNANPWNTRNKDMLGFECTVRVAQPQELWNILPRRRHTTSQKRTHGASPSKVKQSSGVLNNMQGFSF